VIHDVDDSLRSLVSACVAGNGKAPAISFEPPTPEWAKGQSKPVIDLFLYDVREDLEGKTGDEVDVRNEEGRVIGRQPPPRRYALSYLVSAWASDTAEEHRLLGEVLARVPDADGLPAEHRKGSLADHGLPVEVEVAPTTDVNTWDLWSALGTAPRTAIDIVVTAPYLPPLRTDLGPPAEKLDLGLARDDEPPGRKPLPPELAPERAESAPAEAAEPAAGRGRRRKTDEPPPAEPPAELATRPGKRWATFKVREHVVGVESESD
jgi:hypothetical protein